MGPLGPLGARVCLLMGLLGPLRPLGQLGLGLCGGYREHDGERIGIIGIIGSIGSAWARAAQTGRTGRTRRTRRTRRTGRLAATPVPRWLSLRGYAALACPGGSAAEKKSLFDTLVGTLVETKTGQPPLRVAQIIILRWLSLRVAAGSGARLRRPRFVRRAGSRR